MGHPATWSNYSTTGKLSFFFTEVHTDRTYLEHKPILCVRSKALPTTMPQITQPYVQKSGQWGEGGRNGIHKCPSKISHTFL